MAPTCRLAVVQLDTLTYYATANIDFGREPAPPLFDDSSNTPSYLSPLRSKSGVGNLMAAIAEAHQNDLREKLTLILRRCGELRCHIVLFPEYSIPAELLPVLREACKQHGYSAFAGTHTVKLTPESRAVYTTVGLQDVSDVTNVRKAVAPVFLPDGTATYRFKTHRSKWEADLQLHTADQATCRISLDGRASDVELRICVDALAASSPREGTVLLLVPASSPIVTPFESLFVSQAIREIPGAIANTAFFGGSQVHAARGAAPSTYDELLKMEAKEEGLLVVDLDLGAQFQKRGSAMSVLSANLVARSPFVYEAVQAHTEFCDYVASVRQPHAVVNRAELQWWQSNEDLPSLARDQLRILDTALENGTARPADIVLLLDPLPIPERALPFADRCLQSLETATRHVAELLATEPAAEALVFCLQRLNKGTSVFKRRAHGLAQRPPQLVEKPAGEMKLFVDREDEVSRLRDLLRQSSFAVLQGIPGIGKRTVVDRALFEELPRAQRRELTCVPEMSVERLLQHLYQALGADENRLRAMSAAARLRMRTVVVVHRCEHVLTDNTTPAFSSYLAALRETGCKVVFLTERRINLAESNVIRIRALPDDETQRIFAHFCKMYGAEPYFPVVRSLHGYPLGAVLAARLLRDDASQTFDSLRFFKSLRVELLETLLQGFPFSESEEQALQVLSIFRRPVDIAVLERFDVAGLADAVSALTDRFLVEHTGDQLLLMPLVRELAVQEWGKPGGHAKYHRIAADHFCFLLQRRGLPVSQRFEWREEGIYHLASCGEYNEARKLSGGDWVAEAKAACIDLYHSRDYVRCLEVCEQLLSVQGDTIEVLGRAAMCAGRRRNFIDAGKYLERLRAIGLVPPNVLTSVGESLIANGAPSEGIRMLQEVREMMPSNAYVVAALAESAIEHDSLERARDLAAEALEIDPDSFRALDVASRVARRLDNPEHAYAFARRAMALNPRRAQQTYQKALSAVRKKYNGQVPPELDAE